MHINSPEFRERVEAIKGHFERPLVPYDPDREERERQQAKRNEIRSRMRNLVGLANEVAGAALEAGMQPNITIKFRDGRNRLTNRTVATKQGWVLDSWHHDAISPPNYEGPGRSAHGGKTILCTDGKLYSHFYNGDKPTKPEVRLWHAETGLTEEYLSPAIGGVLPKTAEEMTDRFIEGNVHLLAKFVADNLA